MKNSRWTGTFTVSIQDSGKQTGSASWVGDLNFTVTVTPPPGAGGAALLNKVTGSFRATFTTDATDPAMQVGTPTPTGLLTGLRLTGQGSAVGNLMGDYDPNTNSIDITGWIPMLTQANGSWVSNIGSTNPGPVITPWNVNAPATPATSDDPPPAYIPSQSAVQQESAIGQPGVLAPVLPNDQAEDSDDEPSVMLSLNNLGSQQVMKVYSMSGTLGPQEFSYTETVIWTFNLVPPKYTITVEPENADLDPTGVTTTQVVISVIENGKNSQNRDVDITVCTQFGGLGDGTDGHGQHDPIAGDPCDQRTRPTGSIGGQTTFPVTETTAADGTITVQYSSPQSAQGGYYISGTDKIKAVVDDPTISDKSLITDEQPVQTWVQGLVALRLPNTNYYVPDGQQPAHPGQFYGTPATVALLQTLANAFVAAENSVGAGTPYPVQGGEVTNLPNGAKQLRITAMCLPWGGLNDIGPKQGTEWNPPHATHKDGREVDIGWRDFEDAKGNIIPDYLSLLQKVILQTVGPNSLPYANEGGDLNETLVSGKDHFHVLFPS